MAEGQLINVSPYGCAIEAGHSIFDDRYLVLHLFLQPKGVRVELAKICWHAGRRFGVEFLMAPDNDTTILQKVTEARRWADVVAKAVDGAS